MADDFEFEGSILRDSKFVHLLKPIRDLADNWGIDIANDLEEYLAHLNRTAFTFDGGPTLDFAEAALLIQSTACVYSKKVEYLHNLVYQALEIVRSKKRGDEVGAAQEGGAATQKERVARAGHDMGEDDTLEAFLAAGRDLKDAEDIDLAEEEDAAVPVYVRAPAALLALEDQGNGAGDGDAGFYRLAQCLVHMSGALLLDANDGDLYDQLLNNTTPATANQQLAQLRGAAAAAAGKTQGQGTEEEEDDDDGGAGGMGDDDDDEDAPANNKQPAQPAATQVGQAATVAGGAVTTIAGQQQQLTQGGAVAGAVQQPGQGQDGAGDVDAFDPYKPLDMHGKGSLPIKPLAVRRPGKNRLRPVMLQARQQRSAAASKAAAAGLVHPEFAYAISLMPSQQRAKRAAAAQRDGPRARGQAGMAVFDQAAAAAAVEAVLAQGAADGEVAAGQEGGWPGAGAGAGGFDDDDEFMGGGDMGGGIEDDMPDAFDLLHEVVGAQQGAAIDAGAGEGDTYEDLCRAHIEAMMAAAAAQEVQTELAQRVSTWRSKIDPVLKDEESRSNFDIQQYGEKIITKLKPGKDKEDAPAAVPKEPVAFTHVAHEMNKYEVSRMFAAMLQLINNKNVAILKGGSPDDPFQLQLLNPELPHKSMGAKLNGGKPTNPAAAAGGEENVAGGSQAGAAEGMEKDGGQQGEELERPPPKANARRPQKKAKAVAG